MKNSFKLVASILALIISQNSFASWRGDLGNGVAALGLGGMAASIYYGYETDKKGDDPKEWPLDCSYNDESCGKDTYKNKMQFYAGAFVVSTALLFLGVKLISSDKGGGGRSELDPREKSNESGTLLSLGYAPATKSSGLILSHDF